MNDFPNTRHRSVPIPESICKIQGGYPDKLVLFKIPASKYWWVRCFMDKKIVKKSTKTTDKRLAIEFAKKFYTDIFIRSQNNLPLTQSPSFERCAREMFEEQQRLIDRGERNSKLNRDDKQKFDADLHPFFKGYDIKSITYKHLDDYITKIASRGLKPSTLKKHIVLIHKIFAYAQREGVLDRIPSMPKVRIKETSRGWFSHDEYVKLRKITAEVIKTEVVVRYHKITDEMRYLITFMVSSFLRPSDMKNLRHRNVQIVENENTYLRIQPESSKTVNTPIVTMEDAVGIYRDLIEFQTTYNKPTSPDDFLFFPDLKNRNYALDTMRRQFEEILDRAKLKRAMTGETRTLYSLRHTAIMFRLTKGEHIDILTLARNARTSVSMIEKYYARPLSAEMNIEKLQSKRKST